MQNPNEILSYDQLNPSLLNQIDLISNSAWPSYITSQIELFEKFNRIYELFPQYQFATLTSDSKIAAVMNSIPLYWSESIAKLPDTGWDWALEKGIRDYEQGIQPNLLCALAVTVSPDVQGKSLSSTLLNFAKTKAKQMHFSQVIIPVRPTFKSKYPLIDMEEYIQWKTKDNLPFDPWLRTHVRCGATIIKVCHQSGTLKSTVDHWEKCLDLPLLSSGAYIFPGGLVPLQVNLDTNEAIYIEPNVWVSYECEPIETN